MSWVHLGEATAIAPGSSRKFEVAGTTVLVANVDGTYAALANNCPHMKGDLSLGRIADGVVSCPRHGSKFDLRTGKNVGPAKVLFLKIPVKDARSYPVKIEGSELLVDLD